MPNDLQSNEFSDTATLSSESRSDLSSGQSGTSQRNKALALVNKATCVLRTIHEAIMKRDGNQSLEDYLPLPMRDTIGRYDDASTWRNRNSMGTLLITFHEKMVKGVDARDNLDKLFHEFRNQTTANGRILLSLLQHSVLWLRNPVPLMTPEKTLIAEWKDPIELASAFLTQRTRIIEFAVSDDNPHCPLSSHEDWKSSLETFIQWIALVICPILLHPTSEVTVNLDGYNWKNKTQALLRLQRNTLDKWDLIQKVTSQDADGLYPFPAALIVHAIQTAKLAQGKAKLMKGLSLPDVAAFEESRS